MKILLIDIDSTITNLALKKIEKYHKDKGDNVLWDKPEMKDMVDKIYVSCIFDYDKDKCKEWEGFGEIGGSGYSLKKVLPREIESVKPRINLGFITRGCIRKCPWCIVPKKEGYIRIVGDLLDLWDGKSKDIKILDNNILALPKHFELICKQARKNKIRVDFNQGLDHRLLTQEIVNSMKSISHIEYRLAFDHPAYLSSVNRAITLLQKNKINRCMWYVLVGFNTTFQEDLQRVQYLRSRNQNGYIMRYKKERIYIPLAKWVNQPWIFRGMTWKQFMNRPELKRYRELLNEEQLPLE